MKPNWENAIKLIQCIPKTYIPGLLVKLTEIAYEKNVFQPGGASKTVSKIERKNHMNCEEFISAPNCITKDNKHTLISSKNPYYKECSDCGEKFILLSKTACDTLNLTPIERSLIGN